MSQEVNVQITETVGNTLALIIIVLKNAAEQFADRKIIKVL